MMSPLYRFLDCRDWNMMMMNFTNYKCPDHALSRTSLFFFCRGAARKTGITKSPAHFAGLVGLSVRVLVARRVLEGHLFYESKERVTMQDYSIFSFFFFFVFDDSEIVVCWGFHGLRGGEVESSPRHTRHICTSCRRSRIVQFCGRIFFRISDTCACLLDGGWRMDMWRSSLLWGFS